MSQRATEQPHPGSVGLHSVLAEDALLRMLDAQIAAVSTLRPAIMAISVAAKAGAYALKSGGKMGYAGAGSSGLMALAECLELWGTFGIPVTQTPMLFAGGSSALLQMTGAVEDDLASVSPDLARAGFAAGDVVICVSVSGGTPYTVAVAEGAKQRGAQVIGLSCVAGSSLLRLADFPILLDTGPELVAGSTRLGAATAQKVALNMLSVLVGISLGHVHDGYMVNVVADNSKLVERAVGIVSAVSGKDTVISREALRLSGGAVKPAILIAVGIAPEQVHPALKASGGHVSAAISDFLSR